MELRVLKYFLTVAQEENITKAAEILHITQPTLSRQIIQLEEELNTQLFIRGKSKVSLTDAGLLFKRRAEEIVQISDRTLKEFSSHQFMSGEIFIGGGETYLMSYVSDVIKEFHSLYPQVTFKLFSGNGDDVKERIDNGLIDIGLICEPIDIKKYDFVRLPKKDRFGILALKEDIISMKPMIEPKDLEGKKIICSSREETLNELSHWMGDYFDEKNIVLKYNLIYNASLFVESGLGYAVTIDNIVKVGEDSKICFKPFYPPLEIGWVLVWKKNKNLSLTMSKFIEILKKTF